MTEHSLPGRRLLPLWHKLTGFLRRQALLSISALAAALSMLAVPPSAAYGGYIDARVLCLLFCLMAVVAGFQRCGLFQWLAEKLLAGEQSARRLSLTLVLLPFFASMLVTNDVALLTFVPFAILTLSLSGQSALLAPVVVLQTVAANLGSMATPVGNPQNLFLYQYYGLNAGSFFGAVLPYVGLSLVLLVAAALLWSGKAKSRVAMAQQQPVRCSRLLWLYMALFALCLLSVFRVLDYRLLTAAVVVCLLLANPRLLLDLDYPLLLTFVCFFIFAGNLGNLAPVRTWLSGLLEQAPLLSAAAASQLISNVPAAVLLSGFTDNWQALLLGVDIGGLGTPIASLASLISLRLYCRTASAQPGRYLLLFTLANLVGLALLLAASLLA